MKFLPTPKRAMATRKPLLIVIVAAGLAIGGLSLTLVVSQSSLRVETMGRDAAFAAMDNVRRKFGAAMPCVERGGHSPGPAAEGTAPRTVYMLAWEHEDDRLVRVSTPYWALRVARLKVAFARTIAPPLKYVALPEIERCGRGLVTDRRTAGGGRVIIWAE
jgi:hypothetical protein